MFSGTVLDMKILMHETGTFSPTQIPRSPVQIEPPVSQQTDSPVSQGSISPVSTGSSMPFSELTLFVVHEMYYLDMNGDDSNDYNNDVTLL